MATTADDAAQIAAEYRAFARQEARDRSPAYEALAESVADDAALVSFVASLPYAKRQPNLLLAAARYLLGAAPGLPELRDLVSGSRAELTSCRPPARRARPSSSATAGCPSRTPTRTERGCAGSADCA